MNRQMICIACPRGCRLNAEISEKGEVVSVEGNSCKRGVTYAQNEVTRPVRQVTTTVRVKGCGSPLVPVRTSKPIPKNMIFEAVKILHGITLNAPVHNGDVVVKDILGTGVDIIAAGDIRV